MSESLIAFKRATAGALLFLAVPAQADDGYRLWLRYDPIETPMRRRYAAQATEIVVDAPGASAAAAKSELERGLSGLLASSVPTSPGVDRDGAILLEIASSPLARAEHFRTHGLGSEGFLIRTARVQAHRVTIVAANSGIGLLYGTFALLRHIQTRQPLGKLDVQDRPMLPLRMLDHWDNLDGTVERGYSGRSLWDWGSLPNAKDSRYVDYARANASVGINGAVLNNVNAKAESLTIPYLQKTKALADVFRPWGIRVYLAARFSAPIEIGGLKTADPLDPAVSAWWRSKADEIYRLIPDFGGFLVKASSEGQPGPQDYGRTHADGANMLADALRAHGGIVVWRAFVYSAKGQDRAKQAYDEFRPLDGKFASNVILQVKNGPIDFQPREPFHPLFGQMPHTRVALEAQITREYLGQNIGVAYLGPMWSEVLTSDTCAPRCGRPVSSTIAAIAGVSNIGNDPTWSGTNFDQANWYAFGRLAWNPRLSAEKVAGEWARMTWTNDPHAERSIVSIMMASREAAVHFMTPLGLAHQMATEHHYGPAPWVCDLQPSWNPCYYNKADVHGIGFDRTVSGSNAVAQYALPVGRRFASVTTTPARYLLWFHHLPWTYRMPSGRTLWDELIADYDQGVAETIWMNRSWTSMRPYVDDQRHAKVTRDLSEQLVEARWWRDASIAYWESQSGLPMPKGRAKPPHPLSWYEAIHFETVPGFLAPKDTRCNSSTGHAQCVQ